jgi:hypothetical protein
LLHAFSCFVRLLEYSHFQIARVWFRQMREVAKVRSVWC